MIHKILWIDTETTGTDKTKHGLTQIAGIIDLYERGELKEEVEAFNLFVKPFPGKLVSPEALEITGKTMEDLRSYPDPREVYTKLTGILSKYVDKYDKRDKMIFAGYNSPFDMDFMRVFFEDNGDKYFGSWFWFPPLDVMGRTFDYLKFNRWELQNFKLGTVAAYFGLEPEGDLHDALTDIRLTKKLYHHVERLKRIEMQALPVEV